MRRKRNVVGGFFADGSLWTVFRRQSDGHVLIKRTPGFGAVMHFNQSEFSSIQNKSD